MTCQSYNVFIVQNYEEGGPFPARAFPVPLVLYSKTPHYAAALPRIESLEPTKRWDWIYHLAASCWYAGTILSEIRTNRNQFGYEARSKELTWGCPDQYQSVLVFSLTSHLCTLSSQSYDGWIDVTRLGLEKRTWTRDGQCFRKSSVSRSVIAGGPSISSG
jgi:hypothetical protein